MLWSLLCLPTLVPSLALSLAGSIRGEREQAALLLFTDDPETARWVARNTDKICRQVAHLLEESREATDPPFLA